jgi:hypothetical protein
MILFHGSNTAITRVDLEKCRPFKDFGKGFYLTPLKNQAEQMAQRTARIYGGTSVVSAFEFDDLQIESLSLLRFELPSKEWAQFVINNRNRHFHRNSDEDSNHDCRYDIVIGPIANDDLALLFRQFENGLIDIDLLVKKMEYKELTIQYSFHTDKALLLLKGVEHGGN